MTATFQHNRRMVGWLLTLALLVMALPSSASWQCPDGKPCTSDCKLTHSALASAAAHGASAEPHCSRCSTLPAIVPSPALSENSSRACTTPHCILRVPERPASTLQEGVKLFAPMLALPPPAFTILPIKVETVSAPTAPLSFYPQRFLRPASGRAPPTLL